MAKSEFGKGLVICLAKFSAHFMNDSLNRLSILQKYIEADEKTRALMISSNPPDNLNYGKDMNWLKFTVKDIVPIWGGLKEVLTQEIGMWMSGAADHLYEIKVPKGKDWKEIKDKVEELKDKAFGMKDAGFTNNYQNYIKQTTLKDVDDLRELTFEICVMVDKKIGLKSAEIGEYQ